VSEGTWPRPLDKHKLRQVGLSDYPPRAVLACARPQRPHQTGLAGFKPMHFLSKKSSDLNHTDDFTCQ